MNPPDHDPLDLLAAEYVLGTLRGARCARFEARLEHDAEAVRRVREWEARLAPLVENHETAESAESAESTWAGVERRLFGETPRDARNAGTAALAWWRRLAVGLASVAVVFLASTGYLLVGHDRPQCYAVLADDRALPVAVVFDRRNMQELVVLPVGSRFAAGGGSVQLWIVADGRALSVGVLNADGETRLKLDKPMLTAVMAAQARLLLTREPEAAPAAGVPAGPRIAEGVVALLGASSPPARAL